MKKGTIAFIGNFNIDTLNASGKRVKGLADAISDDYDIFLIGISEKESFSNPVELQFGYKAAYLPLPSNVLKRIAVKQYFVFTKELLEEIPDLKGVISYGSPVISLYVALLQKWCKKRNITFISDVVDMIYMHGRGGFLDYLKFLDITLLKEHIVPKSDGIISISSKIEDFYKNKGHNKVIVVPPVTTKACVEVDDYKHNGTITIVYAGLPFNKVKKIPKNLMKDRLDWSIELLNTVYEKGINIDFKIFGINAEDFLYSLPEYENILKTTDFITFYGKVDQHIVEREVRMADFTILSRDKTEVTESGFPTKFSESLCLGTPVLATDTSDIGHYLLENLNGMVLDFGITENSINKLYKLLSNVEQIKKMKLYCREQYPFNPKDYRKKIESLILEELEK